MILWYCNIYADTQLIELYKYSQWFWTCLLVDHLDWWRRNHTLSGFWIVVKPSPPKSKPKASRKVSDGRLIVRSKRRVAKTLDFCFAIPCWNLYVDRFDLQRADFCARNPWRNQCEPEGREVVIVTSIGMPFECHRKQQWSVHRWMMMMMMMMMMVGANMRCWWLQTRHPPNSGRLQVRKKWGPGRKRCLSLQLRVASLGGIPLGLFWLIFPQATWTRTMRRGPRKIMVSPTFLWCFFLMFFFLILEKTCQLQQF